MDEMRIRKPFEIGVVWESSKLVDFIEANDDNTIPHLYDMEDYIGNHLSSTWPNEKANPSNKYNNCSNCGLRFTFC